MEDEKNMVEPVLDDKPECSETASLMLAVESIIAPNDIIDASTAQPALDEIPDAANSEPPSAGSVSEPNDVSLAAVVDDEDDDDVASKQADQITEKLTTAIEAVTDTSVIVLDQSDPILMISTVETLNVGDLEPFNTPAAAADVSSTDARGDDTAPDQPIQLDMSADDDHLLDEIIAGDDVDDEIEEEREDAAQEIVDSSSEDDIEDEIEEEENDDEDSDGDLPIELSSPDKNKALNDSSDAVEIIDDDDDDDDEDEEAAAKPNKTNPKQKDDEFDEDSGDDNISYSDEESISSIEAVADDNEEDDDEEEEDDDDYDEDDDVTETPLAKIKKPLVEAKRKFAVKRGMIKKRLKPYGFREKLKKRSIKYFVSKNKYALDKMRHMDTIAAPTTIQSITKKLYEQKKNQSEDDVAEVTLKLPTTAESADVVATKVNLPSSVPQTKELDGAAAEIATNQGLTSMPVISSVSTHHSSSVPIPAPQHDDDIQMIDDSDGATEIEDSPVKQNGAINVDASAAVRNIDNVIDNIKIESVASVTENAITSVESDKTATKEIVAEEKKTSGSSSPSPANALNQIRKGDKNGPNVEQATISADDIDMTIKAENKVPAVPSKTSSDNNQSHDAITVDDNNDQTITASASKKRSNSISSNEQIAPPKRLCTELEQNCREHDKLMRDVVDKSSTSNVDEVQCYINQLTVEVENLEEVIFTKEMEWNNAIHLKKIKEEIIVRLNRRKAVMEIMSTKLGEAAELSILDHQESPLQPQSLGPRVAKELQQSFVHSNNTSINSITMVPLVASTPSSSAGAASGSGPSAGHHMGLAQSILNNRANMKSADLAKEKSNTAKLHRNILPKPAHSSNQGHHQSSSSILNNYMLSTTGKLCGGNTSSQQQQFQVQQQQLLQQQQQEKMQQHFQAVNELLMNGGGSGGGSGTSNNQLHAPQIGRQGPIKVVQNIIDDFRQKHPENVPRRGRRLKGIFNDTSNDGTAVSSSSRSMCGGGVDPTALLRQTANNDLYMLLRTIEGNSRPSSNDSSHSNSANATNATIPNTNVTYDALFEFAKLAQNDPFAAAALAQAHAAATATSANRNEMTSNKIGYPEVTLHPVSSLLEQTANQMSSSSGSQTSSLLHGILTKNTRPSSSPQYPSYAPTLQRLLTAPERSPLNTNNNNYNHLPTNNQLPLHHHSGNGGVVNLTKSQGEITITPVMSAENQNMRQTLLQQQLQRQKQHQESKIKPEMFMNMMDDEADDSVDRLVIDEGENEHTAAGGSFQESVPECQGCKKNEAQFVCAGCGNQWYCSRDCQVSAWDEHSDVCSG